jgi:hypothetical protein
VLDRVIFPIPLVTPTPVPADKVDSVYPDPLPISNCPLLGVVDRPVPPELTARGPVVFALFSTTIFQTPSEVVLSYKNIAILESVWGPLIVVPELFFMLVMPDSI